MARVTAQKTAPAPKSVREPATEAATVHADAPSEQEKERPIRVGVLTISDRCDRGEQQDKSGPAIQAELAESEYVVALYAVTPDERKVISDTLKRWCDRFEVDVILTTGGTGFSPRDVTPEATRRVLERDAPNISQYLLAKGIKVSPTAALSRAVAGIRKQTLIVNLPGSPAGARQCTQWLKPLLPHAVAVLRGVARDHPMPAEASAKADPEPVAEK
jgi:molybdopterin adenylyltransferase